MPHSFPGDPHAPPATEAERAALVQAFQDRSLPKAQWTHAAHLIVGAHFVHGLPFGEAMTAMRTVFAPTTPPWAPPTPTLPATMRR